MFLYFFNAGKPQISWICSSQSRSGLPRHEKWAEPARGSRVLVTGRYAACDWPSRSEGPYPPLIGCCRGMTSRRSAVGAPHNNNKRKGAVGREENGTGTQKTSRWTVRKATASFISIYTLFLPRRNLHVFLFFGKSTRLPQFNGLFLLLRCRWVLCVLLGGR